jgi:hypothetical protein
MAQPHKGPRVQVNIHLPEAVLDLVGTDRARFEVSSTSQYLADLVCHVYDRPGLARELGQREEQLKLSGSPRPEVMARMSRAEQGSENRPLVKMRLPRDVVQLIDQDAAVNGVSSRPRFLEDLVCHVYGRHDLARELDPRKEQLQLAIATRDEHAA